MLLPGELFFGLLELLAPTFLAGLALAGRLVSGVRLAVAPAVRACALVRSLVVEAAVAGFFLLPFRGEGVLSEFDLGPRSLEIPFILFLGAPPRCVMSLGGGRRRGVRCATSVAGVRRPYPELCTLFCNASPCLLRVGLGFGDWTFEGVALEIGRLREEGGLRDEVGFLVLREVVCCRVAVGLVVLREAVDLREA